MTKPTEEEIEAAIEKALPELLETLAYFCNCEPSSFKEARPRAFCEAIVKAALTAAYAAKEGGNDAKKIAWAIKTARSGYIKKNYRWAHARDMFAIGSGSAIKLCKRFGIDPDEKV